MPRRRSMTLLALVALALLAPAACGSDKKDRTEDLPAADGLLKEAAAQVREVTSARFVIETAGTLQGVPLRRAAGQLTRDGDAVGTVQIDQGTGVTEFEFVLLDGTAYLKGPTGGWQSLPVSLASTVYDPSAILDPDRGLVKLFETARETRTEAREDVDGTAAYRVAAAFDQQVVAALVPGAGAGVTGHVWVGADRKLPLRVRFRVPPSGGGEPATVTARFSEYNEPVSVSAPT